MQDGVGACNEKKNDNYDTAHDVGDIHHTRNTTKKIINEDDEAPATKNWLLRNYKQQLFVMAQHILIEKPVRLCVIQ